MLVKFKDNLYQLNSTFFFFLLILKLSIHTFKTLYQYFILFSSLLLLKSFLFQLVTVVVFIFLIHFIRFIILIYCISIQRILFYNNSFHSLFSLFSLVFQPLFIIIYLYFQKFNSNSIKLNFFDSILLIDLNFFLFLPFSYFLLIIRDDFTCVLNKYQYMIISIYLFISINFIKITLVYIKYT